MPMSDYAKTFEERLWVADEPTHNVQAYPAVTDAVIPLPGLAIPAVLTEFVVSQERNPTQGIRDLITRKKTPNAWSIPCYVKAAAAAGTVPSWGLLAAKGYGQQTINGGVSVVYALVNDISQKSVTLWHWADNIMHGFRGALVNTILLELSGSDEGKLTFGGFALNEVFAGTTTLNGGIDNVVTSIVVTDSTRYQVGPAGTDVVRIQIDSEILEVTAINYGTHTLTVVRAQAGSSAASHSNGAEVAPWKPGADTDPVDTILPLTIGDVTLGALAAMRAISATVLLDNGMEARLDEYAQGVSTGYRRAKRREITGELRAYLRQQHQTILTDPERKLERNSTFTAGETATARLRAALPKLRFLKVDRTSDGPEFTIAGRYQGLESTTGNDELTLTLD